MKERLISINVTEYSLEEVPDWIKQLVDLSIEAANSAYAPYSKFKVGAAVLLANGEIIKGSNQENAAYPSGLCAERVAVFYSQSAFPDQSIKAISISAFNNGNRTQEPIFPCGSCRQVLLENEQIHNSKITLIFSGAGKILVVNSASDLLPLNFNADSLNI